MADRIIKSDSGNDVVIQNNSASSKIEVNNDGTIVFTGTSTDLIPSGTKMLFQQTAAPTGWTKVTSSNDVALRVVSGTVGSGGSVAFETAFASHTPTITMSNSAFTLTTNEIPSHKHYITADNSGSSFSSPYVAGASGGDFAGETQMGGGSGNSHTHSNTASSSAINMDVSFVDVIIASKD